MKRLRIQQESEEHPQRRILTEAETLARLKTIKQWRQEKLKDFRRTGRVPRSTRTD